MTMTIEANPAEALGILTVRRGPGANCSSIGSAVEMLFLSAAVGATVLIAVSAALQPRLANPVDGRTDESETRPSPLPDGRSESSTKLR